MTMLYHFLGSEIESQTADRETKLSFRMLLPKVNVGLRRKESKFIIFRLSLLFGLDAFACGFVTQSWIAFWFSSIWKIEQGYLRDILSLANIVAGLSGITASYFVNKYGAINTMVYTSSF